MLPSTNDKVEPPLRTTRRGLTTEEVVIELGVYTDSSFTAQFPSTDVSKRVELMILKYNGVIYMRYQPDRFTNIQSHQKKRYTQTDKTCFLCHNIFVFNRRKWSFLDLRYLDTTLN